MESPLDLLNRWVARARGKLRGAAAEVHSIRGFRVVVENSRPDIATTQVLRRLTEALDLIERVQPWRHRHLQRDFLQIWVVRHPTRGSYFEQERTCLTELTFLARTDLNVAQVAASILHEGVHARVNRMGVSNEQRDRAREERLCRRAEVAFGEAVGADLGAPVIARATAVLEATDAEDMAPTIDWREAKLRQDIADLQALDLPAWFVNLMVALRKRRHRTA